MAYYRSSGGPSIGLGGRITPGIKILIIINVSVFALQVLAQLMGRGGDIEAIFGLTPVSVVEGPWIWQIATYMFLHSTNWISHLLLNMLMLWMFGTDLERLWGTRPFLKYYFVCGIGAGILTCFSFYHSTTIGASGGVFGVMLAYGLTYPNRQILLWFLFPMRAITFVLLCVGIELLALRGLQDGVAHFAHLGGMLFGFLYLKRAWRVRRFVEEIRWRLRRRRFRVMDRDDKTNYPYH
jgi:membrane associated rhomboid family serine protease